MTDDRYHAYLAFGRAASDVRDAGAGYDEQLGAGWAADVASRTPWVHPDCLLAGAPGSCSLVQLGINGLTVADTPPDALLGTDCEREAADQIAEWTPRSTRAVFTDARLSRFTDEERATLDEYGLGWGGGWGGHAILAYDMALEEGLDGLSSRISTRLSAETDPAARDWLRAMQRVCGGVAVWIGRHADVAEQMACDVLDPESQRQLAAIAYRCRHLQHAPARDLNDAVQMLWFLHVLDDTDSPGRIDQLLWPWYLRGGATADERRAAAWPILLALWRRFVDCRSWNVCLAGQKSDGSDASNELTSVLLDVQAHVNREAPNMSVRFHDGSPQWLWEQTVDVIARGAGQPAIYNDEVLVPALCALGIPVEHARNYALNGCAQVDIQGMSHMGLEDGEINLLKCLELALHEGVSVTSGKRIGAPTPPVGSMRSLEDVWQAFARQVDHAVHLFTEQSNLWQQVHARTAPHLYRSLLMPCCLDRACDIKRGGPLYNHGQFLTQGIANVADSMRTIQRLVFVSGELSLKQLVAILDDDWAGQEPLRQRIMRWDDAYGNDASTTDAYARRAVEIYWQALSRRRTWRGGQYSGGVIVFVRMVPFGEGTGASADGRLSRTPLADSCGPHAGRDLHGPTAALNSAARLPQGLGASAICLNLKLSPDVFVGPQCTRRVASLFQGYFAAGGQQLQVNVIDPDTLLAAQRDPDRYRHVVVRVGGFCARFVTLSPELQADVIARTTSTLTSAH